MVELDFRFCIPGKTALIASECSRCRHPIDIGMAIIKEDGWWLHADCDDSWRDGVRPPVGHLWRLARSSDGEAFMELVPQQSRVRCETCTFTVAELQIKDSPDEVPNACPGSRRQYLSQSDVLRVTGAGLEELTLAADNGVVGPLVCEAAGWVFDPQDIGDWINNGLQSHDGCGR